MPKIATCTIRGLAPLSFSRKHEEPKESDREGPDDWEKRTWKSKLHLMPDGRPFIPPMSLKLGLAATASRLGMKVPGAGRRTYKNAFTAGVMILDPIIIEYDEKKFPIYREAVLCNADGRRGSGSRVWRYFPMFGQWAGKVIIHILDEQITAEVFWKHMDDMGTFNGLGRFRPAQGGYLGRFEVLDREWK